LGESKSTTIHLPDVYCPFPSRINPHVEAVHERSLAWAAHFRLIQREAARRRFRASRFTWLSARLYPTAGLEELELLNAWMVWLFMFDDQFDDAPSAHTVDRVNSILDTYRAILVDPAASPPGDPAADALRDLCLRTYRRMPGWWRARYTRHVLRFLDTYTWTVTNHLTGVAPPLDVYLEKRRDNGAMQIAIDLIDLAEPAAPPESLRSGTPIETLARITNDVVCWTNDLFSLRKELARGDVNNLVVVLQKARSLTLQQAIGQVNDLIGAQVRLFEETERRLPAFTPQLEKHVRSYVCALEACMRGNLDWSAETYRYSHVELAETGDESGYLEDLLSTQAGTDLE
jgi:hypothetical protein